MSDKNHDIDIQLLELLYDELDSSDAVTLRQKVASEPTLSKRLHGWESIRAMSAELEDLEPDPQTHYSILREARAAVSPKANSGFWAWLDWLTMSPALAGLGLVIVAGSLYALMTGDLTEGQETAPSAVTGQMSSKRAEPGKSSVGVDEPKPAGSSFGQPDAAALAAKPKVGEADRRSEPKSSAVNKALAAAEPVVKSTRSVDQKSALAKAKQMKDQDTLKELMRSSAKRRVVRSKGDGSGLGRRPAKGKPRKVARKGKRPSRYYEKARKKERYQKTYSPKKKSPKRLRKTGGLRNRDVIADSPAPAVVDSEKPRAQKASRLSRPVDRPAAVKFAPAPPPAPRSAPKVPEVSSGSTALSESDNSVFSRPPRASRSRSGLKVTGSGTKGVKKAMGPSATMLDSARRAQRTGNHRKAVRAFEAYLRTARGGRHLARVWYEAALSYERLGNLARAVPLYRLAGRSGTSYARKALRALARIEANKQRNSQRAAGAQSESSSGSRVKRKADVDADSGRRSAPARESAAP